MIALLLERKLNCKEKTKSNVFGGGVIVWAKIRLRTKEDKEMLIFILLSRMFLFYFASSFCFH